MITPFRDGAVDYEKLEVLLDHQMEHGIKTVCVCGTTGEASTLSDEERLSVIAHAVRHCKGRAKVIAGTGSNNTAHAVSLSKMADSMGADGVLVVTPYYNKASSQGLVEHYTQIADSVNCPVILYNVPTRTGVDIPLEVYERLNYHKNIAGVKEASGSTQKGARILASCGSDFTVWAGNDDQIVPLMALGAQGVISVLSNLCPTQTLAMTNACLLGDFRTAGKLQCRFSGIIDALFCDVNPIPVKEAMNLAGLQVGLPRLPLCPMADDKRQLLILALQKEGILAKKGEG